MANISFSRIQIRQVFHDSKINRIKKVFPYQSFHVQSPMQGMIRIYDIPNNTFESEGEDDEDDDDEADDEEEEPEQIGVSRDK